mmetsp:Transcript_13067/g.32271  ORF Transcript_13067/g.32271 Transcript_13067/m.32271 type:complete len:719 (+) Transcript_13067:91-2247(+)
MPAVLSRGAVSGGLPGAVLLLAVSLLPFSRARCGPMLVVADTSAAPAALEGGPGRPRMRPRRPRLVEGMVAGSADEESLVPWQLILGVTKLVDDIRSSVEKQMATIESKRKQLETAWRRSTQPGQGRPQRRGPAGPQCPRESDEQARSVLRDPTRSVAIVTTAVLPWMTGTAVNPLLRAAYLSRIPHQRDVTLLVPWVPVVDQRKIYPRGLTFDHPDDQERYIRGWLCNRLGFNPSFKISFYPGRYAPDKGSILAVGDITKYIPDNESDIAILEEPEHLNWFHHGVRWSDKFNYVLGIVHTNYLEYIRRQRNGGVMEAWVRFYNQCIVREHCHRIVKLSGAVQDFPRSTISYVHGVSPTFIEVGRRMALAAVTPGGADAAADIASFQTEKPAFSKNVYFLGKVLWGKGYSELLQLVRMQCERHGLLSLGSGGVDVYGSGDDFDAVTSTAQEWSLPLHFHGPKDHAHADIHSYKIFINPSLSDVVATTTAEALAMGKFVIVAKHPSNEFFSTFPNCLIYSTPEEFSNCLGQALASEPAPMTDELRRRLTWEAATERLMDAAPQTNSVEQRATDKLVDDALFAVQNTLIGVEAIRRVAGAGPNTKLNPESLTETETWQLPEWRRRQLEQPPNASPGDDRRIHLAFLDAWRGNVGVGTRQASEEGLTSGSDRTTARSRPSQTKFVAELSAFFSESTFPWVSKRRSGITLAPGPVEDDSALP